jgi:23S rRNA pseudouridine1911/1915/1917 synthase
MKEVPGEDIGMTDNDIAPLSAEDLANSDEPIDITVESRAHGWRLDHYLSRLFPNHSRAQLQRAIEAGGVQLNGLVPKASRRLRVNDRVWIQLPDAEESTIEPEDLPLHVLYEDETIIVINKQANLVVHPGRGNSKGTLAGALQFHFNLLSDVAGRHRPGIVHRLDRDTTGVILIAKDNQVHQKISSQFERREVRKEYRAIVRGVPEMASDYIRTFVCTHPRIREKMMVCPEGGNAREAVTFYKTAETFGNYAFVNLHPETGRTHQLRIHMQHIACPIVADRMYIGQAALLKSEVLNSFVRESSGKIGQPKQRLHSGNEEAHDFTSDGDVLIGRQALHAFRLTIKHPQSGKEMQFEAPLPDDFERTLAFLRSLRSSG